MLLAGKVARSATTRTAAAMVTMAVTAVAAAGCGSAAGNSPGRSEANVAGLPQVTTYTNLKSAARDSDPFAIGDGVVVHPNAPRPVHAQPGGPSVGVLPTEQLGSPTWVPVVDSKPGWLQVLLPSRPNRATGWIRAGGGLRTANSPYVIKVETSARKLVLLRSGKQEGNWRVAVGAPKTPTPTGRTFLLALLQPSKSKPSPFILPVGAHSDTLDTFGGGPGTVAFHGWPDSSVFGKAVTHGCVRVPPKALQALSRVPLGTPVLITS